MGEGRRIESTGENAETPGGTGPCKKDLHRKSHVRLKEKRYAKDQQRRAIAGHRPQSAAGHYRDDYRREVPPSGRFAKRRGNWGDALLVLCPAWPGPTGFELSGARLSLPELLPLPPL